MTASEPARRITHDEVPTRVAWGKSRRLDLPRESLGAREPASIRPDPVAQLREQESTRVLELIPLRHGEMLTSPLRVAAYLRSSDPFDTEIAEFAAAYADQNRPDFDLVRGR